jgi:hypothetical protein
MAVLKATRSAQYPMVAEFTFNWDDTMLDTSAVSKDFNAVGTPVFDVINLPLKAEVIGGDLVVETAWATSTLATASIGDADSATRYGSALDLKSAARTALTITIPDADSAPSGSYAGKNIRLTFNITAAAATAGKATVRVLYILRDRANEVTPN